MKLTCLPHNEYGVCGQQDHCATESKKAPPMAEPFYAGLRLKLQI